MTDQDREKTFRAGIAAIRPRALAKQVSGDVFDKAMAQARFEPEVLAKQAHQPEFSLSASKYLARAVTSERVRNARSALRDHRPLLNSLEAQFGVETEVLTAFWGLESNFGTVRGDFQVVSALATLAVCGRRAGYFENQLIGALSIIQSGVISADKMLGSWAGAMGHGQFMPTVYLGFAKDFDRDGKRDIWGDDPTDALASIANYVSKHGWKLGQPWGVEVCLPEGFDYACTGLTQHRQVSDWVAMNVTGATGAPIGDYGPASIILPAGADGVALMVFRNFHVIMRYNCSATYALAIGHLADRILGGKSFNASWPSDDTMLGRSGIRELQMLLTDAGFDTRGVDGQIGPNSTTAIRAFQVSRKLVADGYPSLAVLQRLRSEA